MADFDVFAESQAESICRVEGIHCLPPVRKILVADSGIVSLLAKVCLLTCAWKRDAYVGWRDCQEHLHNLFQKILPIIECSYRGHSMRGAVTLHRAVASKRDIARPNGLDKLRTVSFSFDNGNDVELRFHQEDYLEVHWFQRLTTWEYGQFSIWLIENQGHKELHDSDLFPRNIECTLIVKHKLQPTCSVHVES